MPCSEKRARKLLEQGEAIPQWKNQIFHLKLLKDSKEESQDVTLGIDTGSKREGFTVTTDTNVVLNILAEAKSGIKESLKTRKDLRRNRRSRKTPYRKCRFNRDIGFIPPSTKARWDNKLRTLKLLQKILPITVVNIEDISARTKKGQRKWNKSFSPLQIGKEYFRTEVGKLNLILHETGGYTTKETRDLRGFKKTSQKLKDVWEAHCVDSHVLCEIATGTHIKPFKGMYKFECFKWSRRQLHVQNYTKGGIRKEYGRTVSLGIPRGTLCKSKKNGIVYVGGTSKGKLSLHSLDGKRLTQNAKKEDLMLLTINKWRTTFLPDLRSGVSSRKN